MNELADRLDEEMRRKITQLLEKPYEGSGINWKYPHEQAKYSSNCHGTMEYIFGLRDEKHPRILSENQMNKIIRECFTPVKRVTTGNLIGFYEQEKDKESLLHTAIMINPYEIFHQSGTCGWFEVTTIEKRLIGFRNIECEDVSVKSFRRV